MAINITRFNALISDSDIEEEPRLLRKESKQDSILFLQARSSRLLARGKVKSQIHALSAGPTTTAKNSTVVDELNEKMSKQAPIPNDKRQYPRFVIAMLACIRRNTPAVASMGCFVTVIVIAIIGL